MLSCCSASSCPLARPRGELRFSSNITSSGMPSLTCPAGFGALPCCHLCWHGAFHWPHCMTLEKQVQHGRAYWTLGALPGAIAALPILIRTTWRAGTNIFILQRWRLGFKVLKTAFQSLFFPSRKNQRFETGSSMHNHHSTLLTLWRKTPQVHIWDKQPPQV